VAGKMLKGSARIDYLGVDGSTGEPAYGLYADHMIDKTREDFEDLKYRIDNGFLDSFSIEFMTKNPVTGEPVPGAFVEDNADWGIMRTLLPGTELIGDTLTSNPMNEHAIMLKEAFELANTNKHTIARANSIGSDKKETKEEHTMPEDEGKKPEGQDGGAESGAEDEKSSAEAQPATPDAHKNLPEDVKEKLRKYDEIEKKEAKEALKKELTEEIKEDLKKELSKMEPEKKTKMNTASETAIESKEFKEFESAVRCEMKESADGRVNFRQAIDKQWKMASEIISMNDSKMFWKAYNHGTTKAEGKDYSNFTTNGRFLEAKGMFWEKKGLGVTSNQNSDTDYLLSAAELSDVFDPVVYNALNQKTTTWGILQKDDFSSKGNHQVQFTLKTLQNQTAEAYTGNSVSTGRTTRLKYQTKFKKYQVGVEVDGDMIAAARGGPMGDVLMQEVRDSTDDLMEVMNQALFAEVGLETAAGVIGFEYICDSAGNTTLYNITRSAANKLSPTTATDTYINGNSADLTKANLRKAIRQAIEEGADLNNLVFVGSPIQYDKMKALYDDLQRMAPTSARFGFEGRISFEEVPFFYDKDCNDDDVFLVDLETHRIAVWVPPTLEMLGKDSDSEKGFIKTYWCTYNRAPRRMVMIYGNKTT